MVENLKCICLKNTKRQFSTFSSDRQPESSSKNLRQQTPSLFEFACQNCGAILYQDGSQTVPIKAFEQDPVDQLPDKPPVYTSKIL